MAEKRSIRRTPRRASLDRKPDGVLSKQLAAELGVSVSTVSRAFSAHASIAPETREKVLQRAREIGYRPNPFARTLITRKNDIVAILVSDLANPFYPAVLSSLTSSLQYAGFNVMLFAYSEANSMDDTMRDALHYQPDVLIALAVTVSSQAAHRATEAGTQVLFFNRYIPAAEAAVSVTCNNIGGATAIADYLIDRGHRDLVYVSGHPDTTTNLDRLSGFHRRCVERIGCPPRLVEAGEFSHAAGFASACALFEQGNVPDAVFCANDVIALGVLDAARESGIDVPARLSVVGFDNIELAEWASYGLTTYRQPVAEMIEATVGMVRRISTELAMDRADVVLDGGIVERRTVADRRVTTTEVGNL